MSDSDDSDNDWSNVKTSTRAEVEYIAPKACECGSTDILQDEAAGEVVCRACGLVVEDQFFSEARDRDLKNDDGTSKTLQRTEIDNPSGVFSTVVGGESSELARIQASQNADPAQKRQYQVKSTIDEVCQRLDLSTQAYRVSALDMFVNVVSEVEKSKKIRTLKLMEAVAVCLHLVCQETAVRDLSTICKFAQVKRKIVNKRIVEIRETSEFKRHKKKRKDAGRVHKARCTRFMPRFISALGLPYSVTARAEEVGERVGNESVAEGKQPQTVAGAVLVMLLCKHSDPKIRRDIQRIADVVGKSKDAIMNCYKILEPFQSMLLAVNDPAPATS